MDVVSDGDISFCKCGDSKMYPPLTEVKFLRMLILHTPYGREVWSLVKFRPGLVSIPIPALIRIFWSTTISMTVMMTVKQVKQSLTD